jgi:NTP pyrophosphatase (non-canonical NTP hydrolase)
MTLNDIAREAFHTDERNGFEQPSSIYDVELVAARLALIMGEGAEALDEIRQDVIDVDAFGLELADIILRTAILAHATEIDLDKVVSDKMAININRPFKHGGKRF